MAVETRFQNRFRQKIEERLLIFINQMADGGIKDYSEYRDTAGRIQGLRDALEILNEAATEYEESRGE